MRGRHASDQPTKASQKSRSGSTVFGLSKRTLRLYHLDGLKTPRCWMWGPQWKRHFQVRARRIAEVAPASAKYFRTGATVLVFSFEDDIRELVLEEIRPGVYAQWSDPRERYR